MLTIMGSNQSSTSLNRLQKTVTQQDSDSERERQHAWRSNVNNVSVQTQQNSSSSVSSRNACDGGGDIPNNGRNGIFPYKDRGTLVVVKEAEVVDLTQDPTVLRLNSIPLFTPIIQNRDKLTWSKEGETIRQRLDHGSCSRIGSIVECHVRMEGTSIAKTQNNLSLQVKDVDQSLKQMIKGYTSRQKAFARHAECLTRMNEFAHSLGRCQAVLNEARRLAHVLNNLLPETERLEPFVWVEQEETELVPMGHCVSSSSVADADD